MADVRLSLIGGFSGDQLRGLRDWLSHEGEFRGRVKLVDAPPKSGTLGAGLVEALTVGLGSGGAITVLVSQVVSWVRQLGGQRRQPVPVEVHLEFANGESVKIVTSVAQGWTRAELEGQVSNLAGLVAGHLRVGDADEAGKIAGLLGADGQQAGQRKEQPQEGDGG